MKQTERLQQQLQDENGNIVIDWVVYLKDLKNKCVSMGLLK